MDFLSDFVPPIYFPKQFVHYSENLSMDGFLLTQMDGDHYIPISTIATIPDVTRLGGDLESTKAALKGQIMFEFFHLISALLVWNIEK